MASIRWKDKDLDIISSLGRPGETEADTLRRSLRWASKFQEIRKEKIIEIKQLIGEYDISPGEFLDIDNMIKKSLDNAFSMLLQESKKCKMRDQKPMIRRFREKYRV